MEIKPEIKYTDQGGKKDYFVGVKGSLTWEEFGKFFKKYNVRAIICCFFEILFGQIKLLQRHIADPYV